MVTVPDIARTLDSTDEKVSELLDNFAPWVPFGGGGDAPRTYPAWVAAAVADIEQMLGEGTEEEQIRRVVRNHYGRENLEQSPTPRHIERELW